MIDWEVVESALKEKRQPMYYMGGTLSCPCGPQSFVALNLDGSAFNEHCEKEPQPEHILKLTKAIYLETKGETDYFKDKVRKV